MNRSACLCCYRPEKSENHRLGVDVTGKANESVAFWPIPCDPWVQVDGLAKKWDIHAVLL